MLTNCIALLQQLTPQMVIAALVMALVVTAVSRLLLVPLALLIHKAPRWLSFLFDALFLVGAILVSAPVVYLCASAGLRRVNQETVLAARTLGMRPRVIRRQVILPQARGWIRAGLVLCFLRAFLEALALVFVYIHIL